MNSKKYNELLEKYYQGLTSLEEERWLKEEETRSEPLPLHALQTGQPVMEWSFDEMLQQAAQQNRLKAVSGSPRLGWMKYAAAVALLLLAGVVGYINMHRGNKTAPAVTAYHTEAIPAKPKELISNPAVPPAITVTPETKKIKKLQRMDKNLPAPVAREQKKDEFLVTVDGRVITDEAEALAILQQSFSKISGDLKETMTNIHQSPKLDVKFK